MARATWSRASLDFVPDHWVFLLIIIGPVFAISWVRTIIIVWWAIILAWWGTAHHVLFAIIHKVIVLATDGLAILLVSSVFLKARWCTILLLMLKVHCIAIRSVVLPCATVFVHILPLRNWTSIIIRRLNLCHSHCSRVISRGHATRVFVSVHWNVRFLCRCKGILIPKGGGLWMWWYAISCTNARLYWVLTTSVMSLIYISATIASCWQSILINIGFCLKSFCFIIIAGTHRRVLITHFWKSFVAKVGQIKSCLLCKYEFIISNYYFICYKSSNFITNKKQRYIRSAKYV